MNITNRDFHDTGFFLHSPTARSRVTNLPPFFTVLLSPAKIQTSAKQNTRRSGLHHSSSRFFSLVFSPLCWSFAMTWIRERRAGQRRVYVGDEYFPPYSRQFSLSFLGKRKKSRFPPRIFLSFRAQARIFSQASNFPISLLNNWLISHPRGLMHALPS